MFCCSRSPLQSHFAVRMMIDVAHVIAAARQTSRCDTPSWGRLARIDDMVVRLEVKPAGGLTPVNGWNARFRSRELLISAGACDVCWSTRMTHLLRG